VFTLVPGQPAGIRKIIFNKLLTFPGSKWIMEFMERCRVGLRCTGRYMDVLEGFRMGLGCTGRYMDVMEGFRVGLGCTGRYMAAIEWLRWALGVHECHSGVQSVSGVHRQEHGCH
jgi:hypothetical protein